MIRVGLVGAVDPRHRWFLAAAQRRRAGVRVVGLSEPDAVARERVAEAYGLAGFDDHQRMLTETAPSLVAVAVADPGPVVIDALRYGADVLVAPPVCRRSEELTLIAELAADAGRRVTAAYGYRGHPAARTAAELIGRLGPLESVYSVLAGPWSREAAQSSIMEALDLCSWLTGALPGDPELITGDHPARAGDDPELRAGYGELIMVADARVDGASFEVRQRPAGDTRQEIVGVSGENGALEWDPRTGVLRSVIGDGQPVTISCGRPDQGEWVLNHLLRKLNPVISTAHSVELAELLLSLEPIDLERR